MEKAYRRRTSLSMTAFFIVAFGCLAIGHFAPDPFFYPLIAAVFVSVGLAVKGNRFLFPLAWRTFDAPRASPALEDEARSLAKEMGAAFVGLRLMPRHSRWPTVAWAGKVAIVSTALRDLPGGERRFALALALSVSPDGIDCFVQYAAQPLFYGAFAAWLFDVRVLAVLVGGVVFVSWSFVVLRKARLLKGATGRALEFVDRADALAYWQRLRGGGSLRAAREVLALGMPGSAE